MKFFEDHRALDSLRHSDFDALSAYGEVIDNSLQANASTVNISFELSAIKHNYEQIETLAFGDDGDGMDKDTLHACLKLGWSSRFNDRSGIGRFGVGMVLGAIHEVQKVEVYSKVEGGSWLYTYIDLQEIENGTLSEIPIPKEQSIPEEYLNLAGANKGTLVLWSKYDKQNASGSKIKKDAEKWIGRTFRYFIWDGVRIVVDGQEVKAHDPLYVRTEKTAFPNDPKAKSFDPITFDWPISERDVNFGKTESQVIINMSQLPEEFRPSIGSGGHSKAVERRIDENAGISILRNRREVFFGPIPYWSSVKFEGRGNTWNWEEIDRWWGCEVLFDAELDSDFSVRNIKRGANPLPELKRTIKKLITPTRTTVLEEVRRVWEAKKKKDDEEKEEEEKKLGRGKHSNVEKIAQETATPKSKFKQSLTTEEAAKKLSETTLRTLEEDKKAQYLALFKSQPFTIQEDNWRGQTFWEIFHGGGHSLLSYNMSHDFFVATNELLSDLESGDGDPAAVATEMRELVDLVLISMAKAQSLHDENEDVGSSAEFIENLNNQWGLMLSNYVKQWRKTESGEK